MLEAALGIIRDFAPWDLAEHQGHGARRPVAAGEGQPVAARAVPADRAEARRPHRLRPSDHGPRDTWFAFGPIAGQGAGCGARQAGFYVDAVLERGDTLFDETRINGTFEGFSNHYGGWADTFNNVLL
jgi:hypothetical protein